MDTNNSVIKRLRCTGKLPPGGLPRNSVDWENIKSTDIL